MAINDLIQATAVALNTQSGEVPEWIQLLPAGTDVSGRDGRTWKMGNPQDVVTAFNSFGGDLPVDFEHATQVKGNAGEAAPAVGWIKELDVRDGAIWGRVDWNEQGRNAISSKGYRYVSPVFNFGKAAKNITTMVSAGLTNLPNLKLAALNKDSGHNEEKAMDKAILEALGLKEGASDGEALTAINKLKSDESIARNRADQPDAAKFVPIADYQLATNKLKAFETAASAQQETAINSAVDLAIETGKVAPASRDYHVAACKEEGGLDRFKAMVDASPEIAGKSAIADKDKPATNKSGLSDEEQAVCRQLGMTTEDFAKAKAAEQE